MLSGQVQESMKKQLTLDYQSKLPSLPLPDLEDTCQRYLRSVRPLVNDEEFAETVRHTNLFRHGVGKELQTKLQKLASTSRNWLAQWWYDLYLDYRGPLPVISNVAGGQAMEPGFFEPELGSQYKRASLWIYQGMLKFHEIMRQEIPLQKLGRRYPMDMSQSLDFFCGGRIPGEIRDTRVHHIKCVPRTDGTFEVICNVRHCIVMMKGRIFKLDVLDHNGEILLPPSVEKQLLKIVDVCKAEGEGDAIGSLTAADRDTYYQAYKHLCVLDKQNKDYVELINQAIMVLSFDDVETFGLQDSMEHAVLGECKNRWYDKSLLLVMSNTGLFGSSHDHMHMDANMATEIMKDIRYAVRDLGCEWKEDYIPQPMDDPIELKFIVDDVILKTIKDTQMKHDMLMTKFTIIDRPIQGYGKTFSKLHRVPPDTLVQLAIQLGHYQLHGKLASTYESGTTRMFYQGRTETVRSCTCESKTWVEEMCKQDSIPSTKLELFFKAVETQNKLMMEACQGQGVDRHFFGLRKIAEEEGIPTPSIFTDPGWKLSGGDGSFLLSTSLSGFHEVHGVLAPICFEGYGCFYTIDNDNVHMAVSSWNDYQETDSKAMYDAIVNALQSIEVLLGAQNKL